MKANACVRYWTYDDHSKNAVSARNPRRTLELLKLLESSPHGATEALLVRAHGFDNDMVAGLVRGGLATAEREIMNDGARPVEAVRLQITGASRKAIEE